MTLEERADQLLTDLEVCQPNAKAAVVLMHLSNVAVEMQELCAVAAGRTKLSGPPIRTVLMALEYSEKVDRKPPSG